MISTAAIAVFTPASFSYRCPGAMPGTLTASVHSAAAH